MSPNQQYRPIEYRVVCAIARVALLAQPSMSDAEWKAAVLDTCAKQGWDNPSSDMLSRAMGAVERALQQTMGLRRQTTEPTPVLPPQPDKAWTDADYRALAATVKAIQARSAGLAPSNVRTIPRERWEVSEAAALDQFYREAEADRLGALKRFAEIAIARPAEWNYAEIRTVAEATPSTDWSEECYACRHSKRVLISHHVIQIQHGGSNYVRNRVRVCEACHAAIHPWLPREPAADKTGWFRIGALGPKVMRMIQSRATKEQAS